MSVKYHVNPKTGRPNLCRAKTPESCDYYDGNTNTEAPHFDSKEQARAYVEQELSKELGNTTTLTKNNNDKNKKIGEVKTIVETENTIKLKQLINEVNDETYGHDKELYIQKMQEMGEIFNNELKDRLGFNPDELDTSSYNPDLDKIGIETRKLLSELKETGNVQNVKITGKYADNLRKAISVLPNNAHFNQSIYVGIENKDVKQRGGSFINGKKVKINAKGTIGTNKIPTNAQIGDYFICEGGYIDSLANNGSGASIQKITNIRNCNSRKDYNSFERSVNPDDKETMEAINYIRNRGLYRYGELMVAPEEIDKKYPNFSKTFYNTKIYDVENYFISDMGAPKQKGRSFVKANDSEIVVKDKWGNSVNVRKQLYKEQKIVLDRSQSTIKFKRSWVDNNENSILTHEYCHSLQAHGKNTTEREFFKQLTKDKTPVYDPMYQEELYQGFPNDYMGVERGDELLTVATESWLYPEYATGFYGKDRKESAVPIRNWVAGFWLSR